MMRRSLLLLVLIPLAACAQPPDAASTPKPASLRAAPYPCEGCEVVRAADAASLTATASVASATEPGDRLVLSGRVLAPDGLTPVVGVVLYVHQTDAEGIYRREGSTHALQGWLVTDADGRYRIETVRPGPYPSGGMPAHIHVYVGEPGRAPYYLNDVVFEGDPNVTDAYLDALIEGPDNGVVRLVRDGDGWRGERDLVLAR